MKEIQIEAMLCNLYAIPMSLLVGFEFKFDDLVYFGFSQMTLVVQF